MLLPRQCNILLCSHTLFAHSRAMRWPGLIIIALVCLPAGLIAQTPELPPGAYRVNEGPDVAGELRIDGDGTFQYFLAAGVLDEQSRGRWERRDGEVCLFTEPKPVPPQFSRDTASHAGEVRGEVRGEERDEDAGEEPEPTLLVTWPDGRGVALIDFRLGLDDGEVIEGYTQSYGWTIDPGETRKPAWVELSLEIYGIKPVRFDLDAAHKGPWRFILTPNDFGAVDFQGACLRREGEGYALDREGGGMRLVRSGR